MKNVYTELNVPLYERVIYCENIDVGLRAWIAIHNTKLGPALGGCRVWDYDNSDDALLDVLRLSEGMTYKNALAGLLLGGGKAVIWSKQKNKTEKLLKAMAEFVNYLNGSYIIAEDVGINNSDIITFGQVTKHVASIDTNNSPSPMTAYGVFEGIKSSMYHKTGSYELKGKTVAIQGIGAVGFHLCTLLFSAGCKLIISDINKEMLDKAIYRFDTKIVQLDDIYNVDCDIFAPCALGAILNDDTISKLKCKIVAGSANNQLLTSEHGMQLKDRDILYAPDYVINAGGVINVFAGLHKPFNKSLLMTKHIGDTLLNIYKKSDENGLSTNKVADKMAKEILNG